MLGGTVLMEIEPSSSASHHHHGVPAFWHLVGAMPESDPLRLVPTEIAVVRNQEVGSVGRPGVRYVPASFIDIERGVDVACSEHGFAEAVVESDGLVHPFEADGRNEEAAQPSGVVGEDAGLIFVAHQLGGRRRNDAEVRPFLGLALPSGFGSGGSDAGILKGGGEGVECGCCCCRTRHRKPQKPFFE